MRKKKVTLWYDVTLNVCTFLAVITYSVFLFNSGLRINNLTSGFQLIYQFIKEGSRPLFHRSKLVSHPHFTSLLVKVMLIFFIHILIRKNNSLELQLMATAFLHWQISSATVSPTPSLSSSLPRSQTPSHMSSQTDVNNEYLARTLNSSITVQGTETSSKTVTSKINMPITDTKLAHLQGKIETIAVYGSFIICWTARRVFFRNESA